MTGWRDVPLLTHNEAKANEDALAARITPPDMGAAEIDTTSGSTGTPLKFRKTMVQRVASEVLINRVLRWHDLWPMRAFAMSKASAPSSALAPGLLIVPYHLEFAEQVDMLRRHRTTHALAQPSVAAAWAQVAGEGGLPDLRAVLLTGSVLRGETRAQIERGLGVKVINLYSASELGPLAAEGPDGRLRVSEELVWLEGPRSAEAAKAPTQVVVTPLYPFATPLIRYTPGDYARFSTAAAKQAPGLRRIEEVIGRARNLLRLPDGRPFYPGAIRTQSLAAALDHREWQLVQTSFEEMTLNVVAARPPTAQQMQALDDYLKTTLPHHRTTIALVAAIDNPMANGKPYEFFVSRLKPEG